MANQNIVPFIVVQWWISIHDLCHDITTDFGKGWAEGNSSNGLEPVWTEEEFVDSS